MFLFGSPEDIATTMWDGALAEKGPELPDCHPEEMDEQDLLNCLTYCRMAAERAMAEEIMDHHTLEILVNQFDEVFAVAVNRVSAFRANFIKGTHVYLGGYATENINKYRALANLPPLAN